MRLIADGAVGWQFSDAKGEFRRRRESGAEHCLPADVASLRIVPTIHGQRRGIDHHRAIGRALIARKRCISPNEVGSVARGSVPRNHGLKGTLMTDPLGPLFAAGNEIITASGYEIVYLPDVNNDQLQREGKPATFYWLPNKVRLARADNGDYRFRFVHFVGKKDTGTTPSLDDKVSGGLLAFSTTSAPPPDVLAEAHAKLIERVRSNDNSRPWFSLIRGDLTPNIRPAPIVSNWTAVSSLAPTGGGGGGGGMPLPSAPITPSVALAPQPVGGAAPVPGASAPGAATPAGGPPGPRSFRVGTVPAYRNTPSTISRGAALREANIDPWFFELQGAGAGSVLPSAENAYSALVGGYPAALVWAGFHGGSGVVTVWQTLKLKCWTPVIHLKVTGEWKKVQEHFSANAKFGNWFWDADVKAEWNNLRTNGAIKVELQVDSTFPGSAKLQEELQKRSDLVFNSFMEQAKKMIFEPAPFTEKPAEASKGGIFGWGGGVRVKTAPRHRQPVAFLRGEPPGRLPAGLPDLRPDGGHFRGAEGRPRR